MTLLAAWMDGLTPEMVRKAEEELGETIQRRNQALKDFRRLINGYFDVERATPNDLMAACLVCAEIGLEPEATQVCGAVLVLDFEKFSFKLMKHFASPTFLYRLVRCVQDCVPCRIKAFHIVNEPFYFNYIFNIAKKLLSEKLKKRVHFHGSDLKSMHKYLPPEILPEELGGKTGPMDNKEFRYQILNRETHFEKINKYGFQEKKVQFIRKKSSRALGLFL